MRIEKKLIHIIINKNNNFSYLYIKRDINRRHIGIISIENTSVMQRPNINMNNNCDSGVFPCYVCEHMRMFVYFNIKLTAMMAGLLSQAKFVGCYFYFIAVLVGMLSMMKF